MQKEKQFTLSSLVENSSMSRALNCFLSNFSRPIRSVNGSLAYHSEHHGHDLFLHPISSVKSDTERRDRITQTMVQIVFQEDSTPFSPEFIENDANLETMCFIVVQPINTGRVGKNYSFLKNNYKKITYIKKYI